MEEQYWFLRSEFWTALVAALAMFLSSQFGIELEVEHIVGIVVVFVTYFWKKAKDDDNVAEYKKIEKEIELERIMLEKLKIK